MISLHEIAANPVNPYEDIGRFRAPRNRYLLSNRMILLIEHTITRSTETSRTSGANRQPTACSYSKKSRAL